MTPRERLASYARGEYVDRLPAALSAAETIPLLYGINLCDHYFSADLMVETETRLANEFGADNMGIGLGLRTLPEALGVKLEYPKDSVSYIIAPAITSLSENELNKINPVDINKDGRLPIIAEAFERLLDKFADTHIISSGLAGPFTTAAELAGTEKFLKALIKDKESAHKLLQRSLDCVVKCCEEMNKKLGIKFTLSEPMASRNLLSKHQAEEFFFPYLKQAVERMNKFQGATGVHICGSTRDRWDDVVGCGVSAFWIDNCESIRDLKELYGNKIAISGNVTPVEILKNGTPAQIAEAVRQCILDGADNPCGYTLCPGCTTPVMTSRENLKAFMDAAMKYGKGARKGFLPEGVMNEN